MNIGTRLNCNSYELIIHSGIYGLSPDDNVDVEVIFPNGERYWGTFFTLNNIRMLFEKNRHSGECGNGLYFWSVDMVIVETLSEQAIRDTVNHLIDTGELGSALSRTGSGDRPDELRK
jgi:hypothetical protein